MGFLLQPHGATCTERQSCAMAHGRGREIFLARAQFYKSCTEQGLSVSILVLGRAVIAGWELSRVLM